MDKTPVGRPQNSELGLKLPQTTETEKPAFWMHHTTSRQVQHCPKKVPRPVASPAGKESKMNIQLPQYWGTPRQGSRGSLGELTELDCGEEGGVYKDWSSDLVGPHFWAEIQPMALPIYSAELWPHLTNLERSQSGEKCLSCRITNWCMILDAWGWCTEMTQRDGAGREEGSGWGTRVYLWRICVDVWQNQYNIVK